jgi:hypothetical protein
MHTPPYDNVGVLRYVLGYVCEVLSRFQMPPLMAYSLADKMIAVAIEVIDILSVVRAGGLGPGL